MFDGQRRNLLEHKCIASLTWKSPEGGECTKPNGRLSKDSSVRSLANKIVTSLYWRIVSQLNHWIVAPDYYWIVGIPDHYITGLSYYLTINVSDRLNVG